MVIPVGSEHFHRSGTYYVWVRPIADIWKRFFSDDWYNYGIKFSLRGSFNYIVSDQLVKEK